MEEFRDLDSYYAVSNYGRIKSKRTGKIMSPHSDSKKKGYKYIKLSYDGINKYRQVHRLVALLFLPNPMGYPCVNHKDENPSNNCVDNLEWCSYSYNLSYGTKIDREHATKVENGTCNAPKPVIQIDKEGNVINTFSSASQAGKVLHIPSTHIIDCCNNKICHSSKGTWTTRTAGGFKFTWLTGSN